MNKSIFIGPGLRGIDICVDIPVDDDDDGMDIAIMHFDFHDYHTPTELAHALRELADFISHHAKHDMQVTATSR